MDGALPRAETIPIVSEIRRVRFPLGLVRAPASYVSATFGGAALQSSLFAIVLGLRFETATCRFFGVYALVFPPEVSDGQSCPEKRGAGIEVVARCGWEMEQVGAAPWPCAFWESPLWSQKLR